MPSLWNGGGLLPNLSDLTQQNEKRDDATTTKKEEDTQTTNSETETTKEGNNESAVETQKHQTEEEQTAAAASAPAATPAVAVPTRNGSEASDSTAKESETMQVDSCSSGTTESFRTTPRNDTWRPLRSRSFLTDVQVLILHSHFKRNPFPSKYELSAVAEQIGVNKRVVQVII